MFISNVSYNFFLCCDLLQLLDELSWGVFRHLIALLVKHVSIFKAICTSFNLQDYTVSLDSFCENIGVEYHLVSEDIFILIIFDQAFYIFI